ncbi:MAG: Single-stranded-DNA-specific exonuclease RecJ [Chloroflexi bacterium]|nr:Single-stranded-DNA-specific exonuclease RecJ [Chloroflexota bacterium]
MNPLEKRWQVASPLSQEAEEELHGYPPILQQILYNRGYGTRPEARLFLGDSSPTRKVYPLGAEKGARRIMGALKEGETIAVYGDYDADGVTGTAMLVDALSSLGGKIIPYIPDRITEGYGLNHDAIKELHAQGVKLIITVDCGIRALAEVETGKELGMDIIITDHHHPGPELPSADVIINPKQEDDPYPVEDLAGVGVAYLLLAKLAENAQVEAEEYLDLVAIGTVADMVPLIGENRVLVREGLQQIKRPHRQGLMSLKGVAGIKPGKGTATDIGFRIGPRINAAGRMGSAKKALDLLLEKDLMKAGQMAQELEILNRNRQSITRKLKKQASEQAVKGKEVPPIIFAFDPDFHQGVVGLAASNLVGSYYRPAIIGEDRGTFTTASCRSIPEFNIIEALDKCQDLLEQHGGHAAAAGFTIANENIPSFMACMTQLAEGEFEDKVLLPTLQADAELNLEDLDANLLEHLRWLEPTGYGNPQAKFVTRNIKVKSNKRVGSEGSHLKLKITDGTITFDAIAFGQGDWAEEMPPEIDILFTFEENEFRGRTSLQLNIKDIKAS